jgi:hypothetical protein
MCHESTGRRPANDRRVGETLAQVFVQLRVVVIAAVKGEYQMRRLRRTRQLGVEEINGVARVWRGSDVHV